MRGSLSLSAHTWRSTPFPPGCTPSQPARRPPALACQAQAAHLQAAARRRICVVLPPVGCGGGERPLVQRVVDEHLDHGEHRLLAGAQHLGGGGGAGGRSRRAGPRGRSSSQGRQRESLRDGALLLRGGARLTRSVSSQHRRITPSTPATPMPSTTSRVRRKGTSSGVLRKRPCGGREGKGGTGGGWACPSGKEGTQRDAAAARCQRGGLGRVCVKGPGACLLKRDAQVDVHGVGGARVQQHVLQVSVAQPDDVPRHRVDRHGPSVRQAPLKPGACGRGRPGRAGHATRRSPWATVLRCLAPWLMTSSLAACRVAHGAALRCDRAQQPGCAAQPTRVPEHLQEEVVHGGGEARAHGVVRGAQLLRAGLAAHHHLVQLRGRAGEASGWSRTARAPPGRTCAALCSRRANTTCTHLV